MSTSFKRVISHPEELGNLHKKMDIKKEESTKHESSLKKQEVPLEAVLIEEDTTTSLRPPVDSPAGFRGVSTLSADQSIGDEQEETVSFSGISRNELNLARLDSKSSDIMGRTQRTGSGSSGTFGWFIDVHGGGEQGTPKVKEEEKKKSASNKKEEDAGDEEPTQFIDISQQNMDSGTF